MNFIFLQYGHNRYRFDKNDPIDGNYIATGVIIFFTFVTLLYLYHYFKSKKENTGELIDPNLFVLASCVIKADGNISKVELKKVKLFLEKNFEEKKATKYYAYFNRALKTNIDIDKVIEKMNYNIVYSSQDENSGHKQSKQNKIRWLHFLISIAVSDRLLKNTELAMLNKIRTDWEIPQGTFNSILILSPHKEFFNEDL